MCFYGGIMCFYGGIVCFYVGIMCFYGGILCFFTGGLCDFTRVIYLSSKFRYITAQDSLLCFHKMYIVYQFMINVPNIVPVSNTFFSFNKFRIVMTLHLSFQCLFLISTPVHNIELLLPLHFLWLFPRPFPHSLHIKRITKFCVLPDSKRVTY